MSTIRNAKVSILFGIILLGCLSTTSAVATELTLRFALGNQEFTPDRSPTETEITTDYYLAGFELSGITGLPYGLQFHYGLERDLRLRTMTYLGFGYVDDRVFFSVTPIAGLLNSGARPVSPGVRSSIGFFIFDRGEIEFALMRPFLTGLSDTGSNNQSLDQIRGKLYLNGYLLGADWSRSIYRERQKDSLRVSTVTEYGVYTEIFQKNVPYQVTLRMAYQDRQLEFDDLDRELRTGTIVFGPSATMQAGSGLSTTLGINAAIFTLGREELAGESVGDEFLFTFDLGVTLDLARMGRAR